MAPVLLMGMLAASALAAPEACAPCHRAETAAFEHSSMARALETGAGSAILRTHPVLKATIEGYSYEVTRETYAVTDGKETLRIPLAYAFGQGSVGQTWLFRLDGRWYESRVSYYTALNGLDITMGAREIAPRNIQEAAGRLLTPSDAADCFACHSTKNGATMRPGVQCERCHGASESHVSNQAPMRKLNAMTTEEMSDFCGRCHRSWSQIMTNGPRGILNIRFQPYRLTLSKCYDAEDRRIRCTACHDPHGALVTSARFYDSKCLACHSSATRSCPVSKADCVTCHMPRLELPGAHKTFTDHRIRIVHAKEQYPD